MTTSLYDLTISSSTGESINLGKFQGKPLLIINTASHCKFTPQYEDLQDLWLYFKNWDLNIIAIPSGISPKKLGMVYNRPNTIETIISRYFHIG